MKKLNILFKQIFFLCLLIPFTGCEEDDIAADLPEVVAGFTYLANMETGTVSFLNISENATKYSWTFGNGETSTEKDPIQTFTTGSYTVTLTASNTAGGSDSLEEALEIIIVDAGTPVITLLGDATVNVIVGETYTDAGATATDDVDGDITANIVVVNPVDVNIEDTYIVTYNVTDSYGNAATEVTRTVIVAAEATDPTVGAPVPTQDASNVISIFSDTYTDLDGTNLDTNWQGDIVSELVTIDGNAAMKYSNAKFIGMQLSGDTDLSTMEFMHVDIWTPDATVIEATPISPPNENLVDLSGLEQGEWKSFDIPVTDFTGVDFTKVLQFKFDATKGVNPAIIFIDNLYFYKTDDGTTPTTGAYIYSTEGTVDIVTVWGEWGTGTTLDGAYDQDPTYNPSIKLSGGSWGSLLAFTQMPAGTLSGYETLQFKINTSDATVKVKVPEVEKEFNIADGTALEGGWVQMSIPLSTFGSSAVDAATEFAIWGSGGSTLYLTDVMLSGESDGGTDPEPSNCPAPPNGELLSNGDFESGDVCWQFLDGTSLSTTTNNGGSNSGEIQGAPSVARTLKMERFGAGTVLPNTSYTVTFDIIADGDFGVGGLMKAFTFSEGADGGSVPATLHVLTDSTTSIATSWETMTFTFITPSNANQVEGGLSFLVELVNSTAKLNIDNVVVKVTP